MKLVKVLAVIYAIAKWIMEVYKKVNTYLFQKELDKAIRKAVNEKDTSDIERIINK